MDSKNLKKTSNIPLSKKRCPKGHKVGRLMYRENHRIGPRSIDKKQFCPTCRTYFDEMDRELILVIKN